MTDPVTVILKIEMGNLVLRPMTEKRFFMALPHACDADGARWAMFSQKGNKEIKKTESIEPVDFVVGKGGAEP